MYNPFKNGNNEKQNTNDTNPYSGSYYSSSYQSGSYPPPNDRPNDTSHQVMWQGDYYHSYQSGSNGSGKPPKQKKPWGKGKKRAVQILAGVMACMVVSVGSVGLFAGALSKGYIKLNNAGTADSAFTVTKLVDNSKTTSTVATGQLTLQEVAQKVIPSVVCIQNYSANSSQTIINGSRQSELSPASEGSGIIATKDGYIITNAHVVENASSLKVILSTGVSYEAKLIGSDSVTDLAVIKIDAPNLTPAEFGSSGDLKVADTVMAIGNPGGVELNSSVTIGYVSALNRQITNSESGYTINSIQTDAAINPGNSGGALVNVYGQVIGINSSKISQVGYEGLGFAIPIDDAQPVISSLKQYGYVKDRAVLGINGQFIDTMTAQFYNLPSGMYVASVTNSALTKAGITKGCVITKVDNVEVTSANSITAYISKKKPGDTVTLAGQNSLTGESFSVKVKLAQATGK